MLYFRTAHEVGPWTNGKTLGKLHGRKTGRTASPAGHDWDTDGAYFWSDASPFLDSDSFSSLISFLQYVKDFLTSNFALR